MKRINKYTYWWVVAMSMAALVGCASTSSPRHVDKCVKLGQEWQYDTRKGEEGSRLIIVDAFISAQKQRFYVVRVTGIKIDEPNFRNYFPDGNAFFILTEQGLEASLVSLVGESTWNKHYDRYYAKWRKELSQPDYFGNTVKDKLNVIEETLNIKLGA